MLVNLKEILQIAEKRNIAIGMFNATGFESIQAIIKAAEELNSPVILAHAEVHNIYNDISLVAPAMIAAAKNAKVPVCVHLDHGTSMEMIDKAISLGFTSIMFDGSALPYEENLKLTKSVVEKAHKLNISVEGELGRLVTTEDGKLVSLEPKDYYTDPVQAQDFVNKTGVDALAISFGTAHGFYKSKPVLSFDVVQKVSKLTKIPLVMHGGSGVSYEDMQKAISCGIRKINYYSYMSKAGYEAAKEFINTNKSNYYHDVSFIAGQAMYEDVKKAIDAFNNNK